MISRVGFFLCSFLVMQVASATDIKSYLFQALDGFDGKAAGIVTGDDAERFRQRTKSTEPVNISVSTVKHFKQKGCSRLAALLTQEGVMTKEGVKVPFAIRYELNLCRDGRPPVESIDLSKLPPAR